MSFIYEELFWLQKKKQVAFKEEKLFVANFTVKLARRDKILCLQHNVIYKNMMFLSDKRSSTESVFSVSNKSTWAGHNK